jgi:benzaldehyde dehydrogenase (NAD)
MNMNTEQSLMKEQLYFKESLWRGKIFDGDWIESSGGQADDIEPATGSILTRVGVGDATDVRKAAHKASAAQRDWGEALATDRAEVLRRAAELLRKHQEEVKRWVMRECGGVRPKADIEFLQAHGHLLEAAAIATQPPGLVLPSPSDRLSLARRIPRGVVGVISPNNFPLVLSTRASAPALALGNAVVLKPDLETPVCGGFILAQIFEEAGLPAGLLQVLPGGADAGQAICEDPRVAMVSFTGSTGAGRKVAEIAGRNLKKVSLELGGKNPMIILEDADAELAASNAAFGSWTHQGQICMATGRILVHEKLAPTVTDLLTQKAKQIKVGNPAVEEVALGPLITRRQLERVDSIVRDSIASGARLRAGGEYRDLFYQATVLDRVTPSMRAFREEIFGPVAPVTTFQSDEEAIALASDSEYGLSLSIISSSLERGLALSKRIPAGLVHINDQTIGDDPFAPFGGVGASGNGARHGGPANWEEFTQWQWVTLQARPPRYQF